jgi:hypothetical protein
MYFVLFCFVESPGGGESRDTGADYGDFVPGGLEHRDLPKFGACSYLVE